jgi:hypothetical protein
VGTYSEYLGFVAMFGKRQSVTLTGWIHSI